MKVKLIIVLMMFAFGFVKAQTFSITPVKTYTANLIFDTPEVAYIYIENTGTSKINLSYYAALVDIPVGWTRIFCDTYVCHGDPPSGIQHLDSLEPGNTNYVQLSIDPKLISGTATVKVYVYQNGYPNTGDTITWHMSTEGVGVNEISAENSIKVFPNPVKDILTIHNQKENTGAIITDALGRKVWETRLQMNSNSLDLSSLQQGVYTLTIKSKEKQFYKRIVKE